MYSIKVNDLNTVEKIAGEYDLQLEIERWNGLSIEYHTGKIEDIQDKLYDVVRAEIEIVPGVILVWEAPGYENFE